MSAAKKVLKAREMTALLFLVLLFILVGIRAPAFLADSKNVANCFNDSVVYILIAVAMAFAIFIGEIDVSVGSNLGLVAAVVGTMLQDGKSWALAFLIGILMGAVVGSGQRLGRGGDEDPLPHLHPGHQRHPPGLDVPSGGHQAGH